MQVVMVVALFVDVAPDLVRRLSAPFQIAQRRTREPAPACSTPPRENRIVPHRPGRGQDSDREPADKETRAGIDVSNQSFAARLAWCASMKAGSMQWGTGWR